MNRSATSSASPRRRPQPAGIAPLAVALALLPWSLGTPPPGMAQASADEPAAREAAPIERKSVREMVCPPGTEPARAESPDGRFAAAWCELRRDGRVARHGPFLEMDAEGRTLRQGHYAGGVQAGRWVRFSPEGEVEHEIVLAPGEAGRHVPQPEDLCPPGTKRRRTTSFSDRREMTSRCERVDENGERVLEGPYVSWDAAPSPRGEIYLLRRIMNYRDDERHGRHAAFEGPMGREVLVEEETFEEGQIEGESRSFFRDGTLREQRFYADGKLQGERVGYHPDGNVRWRVVYEDGIRVSAEGDLEVAGEPCPETSVPVVSADGLQEHCARRYLHFQQLDGPFVIRDRTGALVESGRYERGVKVEQWQTRGKPMPPKVDDDVLVAEAVPILGDEVYLLPDAPEIPPDPWESAELDHQDPELFRAEVERLNALAEERRALKADPPLEVWFRDLESREYPSVRTEIVDGRLHVYGLSPGRYYMRLEYDANRENPRQYPGDLTSSSEFEVRYGEVTQFEAPLLYTLHVISPWDNDEPIPGFGNPCGEEERVPSRVRFAWNLPPGEDPDGIEWKYTLGRRGCGRHSQKQTIAEGRTTDLEVTLDLAPSARAETYDFSLVAFRGEKAIGQVMSFGREGGHGWSIRFRVE